MVTRSKVVSRYGLTRCPHCQTFVRVEDEECLSCGGKLDEGEPIVIARPSERTLLAALRRGFARTRGGVIAASLLGLSTLAGCDDRTVSTDGAVGDAKTKDAGVDTRSDIPIQPPYGIPPGDFSVDSTDGSVDLRSDVPVQPPYGIPPDGGPQPLYGASPSPWDDDPQDDG
ncbi:MAG: hypothetical protein KC503_24195 [Myxococcales bacterium]|nr:hypothetical protein [Myxococcales bacterium]